MTKQLTVAEAANLTDRTRWAFRDYEDAYQACEAAHSRTWRETGGDDSPMWDDYDKLCLRAAALLRAFEAEVTAAIA